MKFVSIVGARPQFVKIAPIAQAVERHNRTATTQIEHVIVHTGQHYDAQMSDVFFSELDLPQALFNLGVGSGHHGSQTGIMLAQLERVLQEIRPDLVVVYGDTNSTLAGSLASVKLHIPVAHVEAGLRSFNRRMPEEINRVVADHACDFLLAPTPTAMSHLRSEGLLERSLFSGDVMYDAVLQYRQVANERSTVLTTFAVEPHAFGLVTVHRAENTDDPPRLRSLLIAFNEIAERSLPLIFPAHPRTLKRISADFPGWRPHPRLQLIAPLGYLDMLQLVDNASVTLTDSGGLQKEAFFLDCPCVTLRDETEWEETVQARGNILTGVDSAAIHAAVRHWAERFPSGQADFTKAARASFGDGRAARTIVKALLGFLESGREVAEARASAEQARELCRLVS
jgi:UDP-GlcNAc3NAcA epimerase